MHTPITVTRTELRAIATDEQIRDLPEEAARAGDAAQVDLCQAALRGNRKARKACETAIRAAAAMVDG